MVDTNNTPPRSESDSSLPTSSYPKYGYEVDTIEDINPRFKCIFCFLVIQNAIQLTECGHRSCRGCFEVRAAAVADENVECPVDGCHATTNKSQIMPDRAFNRELNVLTVTCKYRKDKQCNWIGQLKDYQSHLDEIHVHYICSECNERFTSQAILNEHITKTCPVIFQACPLAPFCTQEMIRKTDYSNHLLTEKHQETTIKILLGEYHLPESSSTNEQDMELNTINKELEEKTSEKINDLSKKIQKVSNETIQLNNDFIHLNERLNTLIQELNNFHITMNERIPIKQSIQPNQEKLQKDIEQLQQRCDNNEHISTDGTLTWRVDHVSEKIADAQSERQTSISSPIFYSSPTGYKMRARLFLFGDGNARRTHVSLFFSLMKGEYDAVLKWPFHFKVTFCLLDQTGNNRHIIDSFYPDVKSSSFQRPRDEANIASGIPKFFPLPMLLQDDNGYVREDTIYIKIIIALNETPKMMLPFMLTLNPALPSYVQENLINQEIAKRQQQQTIAGNNTPTTPMTT
ncbi:unnamed protein product [Rotaria sordida]|uniref:Uncharacterized protein n=1 Tax=Rotaria sordida TaxID=392033 RepID=A0A815PUG3_9BILA|nr:unnamed protein product [Rotaria sordida]CAF4091430.1 unnamed protein product [Rotaria sordida]